MKEETKLWITYTDENFSAAEVLIKRELFNASLHNMQQAVEKYL